MTAEELKRVKVIENVVMGRVTASEAATALKRSPRQVKRLKKRFESECVEWVRHGNHGRAKPWALAEAIRQNIVQLAQGKYAGFNDSHLTEKLVEVEKIQVSRETVRRILRRAGVKSPQKRRAPKYRSRRERNPRLWMHPTALDSALTALSRAVRAK